jgi:hypothetical protein
MMKLNTLALFFICATFVFSSCSNKDGGQGNKQINPEATDTSLTKKRTAEDFMYDCAALKRTALKMDSIILKQTETNARVANDAITAFTDFAYHCNSDTITPIYLIKTAQIAQAINNTPQAQVVLEKCISDYPNFKDRAAAIFLLAQLYDETVYLNNEDEARRLYQKIIDEYPKSDWATSAKGAIQFIGKTDQQILQELKGKNKKTFPKK